jgi:hypothetical protein
MADMTTKRVQNVEIGDMLFHPQGPKAVLNKSEGVSKIFVEINHGMYLTHTHPVMIKVGSNFEQREAQHLTLGDYLIKQDLTTERVFLLYGHRIDNDYPVFTFTVQDGVYFTGEGYAVHNKFLPSAGYEWWDDFVSVEVFYRVARRMLMGVGK